MDDEWWKKKIGINGAENDDFVPNKECLTKKVSIEEVEGVDWDILEKRWLKMKQQIRKSDELWWFTTPPKTWESLCGRAGIALVREGEIVHSIVT